MPSRSGVASRLKERGLGGVKFVRIYASQLTNRDFGARIGKAARHSAARRSSYRAPIETIQVAASLPPTLESSPPPWFGSIRWVGAKVMSTPSGSSRATLTVPNAVPERAQDQPRALQRYDTSIMTMLRPEPGPRWLRVGFDGVAAMHVDCPADVLAHLP